MAMMKLQRRFKDLGIGGITARWYDNNTRKSRLAEMKAYAKEDSWFSTVLTASECGLKKKAYSDYTQPH